MTSPDDRVREALAALGEPVRWTAPPQRVWSAIEREISGLDPKRIETQGIEEDVREPESPPIETADEPSRLNRRVTRRTAMGLTLGGIAAGLGLGGLSAVLLPQARQQVIATATLQTLDTLTMLGRAEVLRTPSGLHLRVDTPSPLNAPEGYLEVWLLHRDAKSMVSLGIYTGRADEEFPITADLLDRGYVLVDISREPFDGDNNHSGDSIVRGQLNV